MKIGLLECDHVPDRYRHIAGDYRDMFAALFAAYAPQLNLRPFDVCNGDWPETTDECDGWLCTGSRCSVYDDVDWIHALKRFVQRLHAAQRPFVGICFGHQMLAEALGGRVAKASTGWGVGVHRVGVVRSEAWMQPSQPECRLQYMHQDQVQQLPENSVVLGESAHCPVAMFRTGETMLGIQAHPEFPAAYTAALMRDRVERIGAERVRAGLESLELPTNEELIVRWITGFLKRD
ncbi:MAG TPA: amidotransferase [Blastocatellia bacterium]|nr:amidotransferase [Blastocatellia bacterium]